MNKIIKFIPNFLTLCNLYCGTLACVLAVLGNAEQNTLLFLFTSCLILDFLDGFSAQLLKAQSELGKQLDSLADVVSFGLFPSVLVFLKLSENSHYSEGVLFSSIGLLIVLFSALRLAKFNLDDSKDTYFKGLATPANAIFWIGFCFFTPEFFLQNLYFWILIFVALSSILMISDLPLYSFKLKSTSLYHNLHIIIHLILSIGLVIFTGLQSLSIIIILYIIISILFRKKLVNG